MNRSMAAQTSSGSNQEPDHLHSGWLLLHGPIHHLVWLSRHTHTAWMKLKEISIASNPIAEMTEIKWTKLQYTCLFDRTILRKIPNQPDEWEAFATCMLLDPLPWCLACKWVPDNLLPCLVVQLLSSRLSVGHKPENFLYILEISHKVKRPWDDGKHNSNMKKHSSKMN